MRILKKRKAVDSKSGEAVKAILAEQMQEYAYGLNIFKKQCGTALSDVGRYWMRLPPDYRNLSHIALVLLSVPPHAAGVERCFSAMGRIHS